jgi:imidazolonepropionase-like amidohydrolase
MKTVVTGARLIDCVEQRVVDGASVTIERGRIVDVRDAREATPTKDARVIDVRGSYLLPGLWDTHVHFEWPRVPTASVAELTVQYAANAAQALTESGITSLRMAGTPHHIDIVLKRAFESGQLLGPRIFAAGWFLTTTGGHALGTGFAKRCDGPMGFVQAIREEIESGADHIKLNLTGGIMGPAWDRHWHEFYLPEEMDAAFRISAQRGFKVMAHAASPGAVKGALQRGAWTVEHGYIMDDECLKLFREKDAWYVPTLGITHLTPDQAATPLEKRWVEQRALPRDLIDRAEKAVGEHREWFRKALAAGVKMALGSDIRPVRDAVALEMGLWVKDGATPWQTLVAATRHAADLCGVLDDVGTVEVGKRADLIVVGANPLADVGHLQKLELVFKDGRLVADHRPT